MLLFDQRYVSAATQTLGHLFPSLVSIYKSVDELGMYKRFREPIKAHQQEMTRIHNNVIDPRHKLLAALHARARQD